ncbi:Cysteine-rich domain protein [uncultured Desulfobacterium sp.]|uniref:Cysteine-rich domain protein n=1 Tax=uncultured Desulfobacterium sp. TaxID=201089 RepID=A0A445N3J0_9BACT|nr:Cysteine-rich domain protein [uncultured Desulfobacterium sp.]
MELAKQITQRQSDFCMECGVCTGSCPMSRVLPDFSPRQMIKRAMIDPDGELLQGKEIWECLTCGRCSSRCPVEIDVPEFIRSCRLKALKAGNLPMESHQGIFQTIAGLQTGDLKQQRTSWAEGAGKFSNSGDFFYFVGCLPYFDPVFSYLGLSPVESARGVLGLLNKIGIEPVISNDERCCGHDALWSGNEATFRRLAELNLEVIRSSGARTVVFSCPEGYSTFKVQYPKYVGELPFEVLHVTELLGRELAGKDIAFKPSSNGVITYHDPCRLGRGAGIYDQPRQLLGLIPETSLVEMPRNRENSLCCGTSAWMECSNCSKSVRLDRLSEAERTGAGTLVTACPKCQIHFTCARLNSDLKIEVKDLYTYLLENIKGD